MRSPISTRRKQELSYQTLEGRRLLAGDVSVALSGSTLVVTGDDLSNQIEVSQNANGDVLFTGLDSTTINGQTAFTFTQTFERSRFELNDGADEVSFDGFEGGREFRFLGGDGDDRLEATGVSARFYHVQGNDGDDAIQLSNSSTQRSAYFHLGDGDDVLAVESFDAGRNFKVFGNAGDDTFASNALTADRKFRVNLGSGDDEALISGESDFGKSARVRLGSGNDFLGVLPGLNDATAIFNKRTVIDAGSDNDVVVADADSTFERTAIFRGRSGTDAIDVGDADFERRSSVRQFESQSVDNLEEILDGIYERLEFVDFDSTQFGNEQILTQTSIQLEIPEFEAVFVEDGGAVALASDLDLQATSAQEDVASATVQLVNGDAADSLSFVASNGITGSFDSEAGVLALSGVASASDYQTVLRSVQFESSGDDPATGVRTVVFSVQSELQFDPITASRDVEVIAVDDALDLVLPDLFDGDASIQQEVNQAFGFTFDDADPDNTVTFQLDLEDSGISADANQPVIDPDTGEFSFTPSEAGTFVIRAVATNENGESDQQDFTISVVDEVEFGIAEIADQTVNFNESLEIQVEVAEATSSSLVFELEATGDVVDGAENLPTISETGLITWTPDLLSSGTANFSVTVTDENQVSTVENFEVSLPGFEPFQGNRQLAAVDPIDRNGIFGDSFDGSGPPLTIDQSLDYTATISTEVGDIVVDLFEDLTPTSVNSFVNLAEDGFYDGLSFHRVIESPVTDDFGLPVLDDAGNLQFERFVAQAGDPTNTSSGGPGFQLNDEILSELTFDRPGILAYARTSLPNTNGSQFFITYDATEFQNDENFTIFGEVTDFGEVIDGANALDRLNLTDPSDFDPATPTIIDSISISVS